jgi:CheY-like chemotaxis protein
MQPDEPLAGYRVLIVEDDHLVADIIVAMVEDAGGCVVGPFSTMIDALANLDYSRAIDAAVLDIGLGSEVSYPLANALKVTQIPFVFLTGRDKSELPDAHAQSSYLQKPFTAELLIQAIKGCLDRG